MTLVHTAEETDKVDRQTKDVLEEIKRNTELTLRILQHLERSGAMAASGDFGSVGLREKPEAPAAAPTTTGAPGARASLYEGSGAGLGLVGCEHQPRPVPPPGKVRCPRS